MANILYISSVASSAQIPADLSAAGHTVTMLSHNETGALPVADLIVVERAAEARAPAVSNAWAAGTPVLLGVNDATAFPYRVGLTNSYSTTFLTKTNVTLTAHAALGAYSGSRAVFSPANYVFSFADFVGTSLGAVAHEAAAVELGSSLHSSAPQPMPGGVAPARAVLLGWVSRYAHGSVTADGLGIIRAAVDWLLAGSAPTTPMASATLTVTTGGLLDLDGTYPTSATLTATTGGGVGFVSDEATTDATLTATTGGTVALSDGVAVYTDATLNATTGGAAVLDSHATTRAHLGATTGGSVWLQREWGRDPITGRGAYQLAVTDRAGTVLAQLSTAYLTRPIVDRLNDVDGTGSGTAFDVPDSATDAHTALRQYRELTVARGGHHLATLVLLNPEDQGTSGSVPWQAAGLGHYLTKRRIGPAVRPGLLPKQWRGGYREGSIPPEAPKWSRVAGPAQVGPSLRVEGSTHVQQTVTRLGSDTTFAFGSFALSTSGQVALREFARQIEVDRDAEDLVDIAPPTITIEGHTDSVPYYDHPGGNQWLSEQRAIAVRNFLAPLVPEGTTLTTVGYGESRPVASNATAAGRAQNRRVDLTYPKMVSARGHRQYVEDRLTYVNPSAHVKRNLTFVSWWQLESYKEPNADGSVIWLGRRLAGTSDPWEAVWDGIDEETPLGTWTRSEVTVSIPADGQTYEVAARLTPPAGTIVYDEGATNLYADDALEFIDVDQADIVAGLLAHAQDPAFDKDDLGLQVRATPTGVKRTKVYYWHDRQTIAECLEELVNISDGLDVTWETTPTTRTLVTHYPRAGQVTGAVLYGDPTNRADPARVVDDYRVSLNGQAAATTVIVQADGQGADREEGVMQGVPADLDLVLEDIWTAEPGTHIGELHAQARRGHAHHAGQVPIVAATVRQELTDEWLDRVELGDVVGVDLSARVGHIAGPHRVTARSIDPRTDRVIYSPTVEV